MPGKKSKLRRSRHSQAVNNLQRKLEQARTEERKIQFYDEFSQKYLMPKSLWFDRLEVYDESTRSACIDNEVYHFFYYGSGDGDVSLSKKEAANTAVTSVPTLHLCSTEHRVFKLRTPHRAPGGAVRVETLVVAVNRSKVLRPS